MTSTEPPHSEQPHRRTRQRTSVENHLASRSDFATAQQVHEALKAQGQTVGLATVYRTLQTMADSGAADVIRTPEGESAYRRCTSRSHHHHLVCRQCGRTVELEAADVEAWAATMAAEHGFTQVSHDVELFGVCPRCED